jgi:hypothetical protein
MGRPLVIQFSTVLILIIIKISIIKSLGDALQIFSFVFYSPVFAFSYAAAGPTQMDTIFYHHRVTPMEWMLRNSIGQAPVKFAALHFCEIFNGAGRRTDFFYHRVTENAEIFLSPFYFCHLLRAFSIGL